MSATTQHATPALVDKRAQRIADIRAFADYLDEHPDVPVNSVFATGAHTFEYNRKTVTREDALAELATRVRDAGDTATLRFREYGNQDLELRVHVGDVQWYEVWARDLVCTPRIQDGKVVWDAPTLDELRALARSED